jgi:hypothetical protein
VVEATLIFFHMTFKEEIDLQLRDNKTLSYEFLSQLKDKNYFSGRSKQIGDTVLFGMLREDSKEGELTLSLITFHEDEIGELYEEDKIFYNRNKTNKLPSIKRIEDGNQEERL